MFQIIKDATRKSLMMHIEVRIEHWIKVRRLDIRSKWGEVGDERCFPGSECPQREVIEI